MKSHISKYALFEYLSGRSNPLERQAAEEWIRKEENAEIFYQWLHEYETRMPQYVPDGENAVEQLLQRVNQDIPVQFETNAYSDIRIQDSEEATSRKWSWLIAASILLATTCGWWFREPIQFKAYQTGYGQTTKIYLEDGTRVILNANSILKIPRFGFDDEVRQVSLVGEGEFTVSHTIDNKRFIVKTSDTFQVEVLGTKFTVFARKRGTKVALTSGSVRIDYRNNQDRKEVMMEPGDLAVLDKRGEVKVEKHLDTKTFAPWKEQRYVFNGTSVQDITDMMEENFGTHIKIADRETARRTITGNFKTRNADELLKTISEVLDLTITASGDSILLTSN